MSITEVEDICMLNAAVRQTASALQILNVTWKSAQELLEDIQERDRETYELLSAFLGAYIDWFKFHWRLEEQGKSGNIRGQDFDDLTRLVGIRNRARDDLVYRLSRST